MSRLPELLIVPMAVASLNTVAADYLTQAQAQQLVFPSATQFEPLSINLTDEQLENIKRIAKVRQRNAQPLVWLAKKEEQILGWVYQDNVIGKHEFITYTVGVNTKGRVTNIEIMSYRETHGGQVRNPKWRINFLGKQLSDQFKLNKDIPNISGATLSCRNITDGVKRLLALHQLVITS